MIAHYPVDLHCHSQASDGALTPEQVVLRAHQRGCRVLALTDHDTLQGIPEAQQAAAACGVRLIVGVEISVTWRKRTIHIVGLNVDARHTGLCEGLESIRAGRVARARRMADELAQRIALPDIFVGAMQYCANPEMIGRTHFARYLVAQGVCKDVNAVFRKYLAEGKPGYVRHDWAQLGDVVTWIRAAGGVAVLAHPGRYRIGRMLMSELFDEFIAVGGEAVEVASGSHGEDDMRLYARYARERELLASAGSDFHALGEGGRDVGLTVPLPSDVTPVWSRWGVDIAG